MTSSMRQAVHMSAMKATLPTTSHLGGGGMTSFARPGDVSSQGGRRGIRSYSSAAGPIG